MAGPSSIEWTDATWNPTRGCTRVSPGCGGPGKHGGCYAERIAARFSGPGQPFHGFAEMRNGEARWTGKLALVDNLLTLPLRWKKPRRIFVNSMSDLFHEALPDEAIDRVFAVMALCPQHTFQVLTKRPERMRDYCKTLGRHHTIDRVSIEAKKLHAETGAGDKGFFWQLGDTGWNMPNVWLGVSAERQQEADERIPLLLDTPAAVRFVSLEPLLGPIDLTSLCAPDPGVNGWSAIWKGNAIGRAWLDWVIVGGESGPHARPMEPEWPRSLRDQCVSAGVPFFFKQHGEWIGASDLRRLQGGSGPGFGVYDHCKQDVCRDVVRVGKKAAGRLLDGRTHDAFPEAHP